MANPESADIDYPFQTWVIGSAVGILLIAIFSDCIFKNKMLFTPLATFVTLQFCMQLGVLITDIVDSGFARNNGFILFFEGMIESSVQFYIYFLTPIQIATEHRVTQEVTPAGTITATSLALTYMFSRFLKGILMTIMTYVMRNGNYKILREIIPLALIAIAALIIWRSVRREWNKTNT